jgi:NADPH-dependent glutamate synthase beta subunit-like oxidoreductase
MKNRSHPAPSLAVSSTTTEANHTGSWKYIRPVYHDRIAPCNVGCPAGVDIEGYMALLRDGKIDEACDLLLREHPIPAVTGRVCNHPCESSCNRLRFDGAVAIHAVERMLGDRILASPLPQPPPRIHDEAVAVIGSGPAGIACAYHLVRLGYHVEIFEQASRPGGMLRQGIPAFRLPRELLDRQMDYIRALGIEIHCDTRLGRDLMWRDLSSHFSAVFLGTGAHVGRRVGVPGDDDEGIWQGLEFLEAVNRGVRPKTGRRVVVIGGGNTAIDCARTALRLGAEPIILYRRTREEMPAIEEEIEDAQREGVEFVFLAAPVAFSAIGTELRGIHCQRMRLGEPDASGRRRPEPIDEGQFSLIADTVLTAVGEDADLEPLPEEILNHWGIDDWGGTASPFVFAGGDLAGDERTVASALGAGKRAAIGIDRQLRMQRGEALPCDDPGLLRLTPRGAQSMVRWSDADPVRRVAPLNEVVPFEDLNLDHFEPRGRHADRQRLEFDEVAGFTEVNLGLEAGAALAEAGRCFNCGVCNGCELCMIYCSDVAIRRSRTPDGPRFEIALDFCKGCGVCAVECPRGAISMTREGL